MSKAAINQYLSEAYGKTGDYCDKWDHVMPLAEQTLAATSPRKMAFIDGDWHIFCNKNDQVSRCKGPRAVAEAIAIRHMAGHTAVHASELTLTLDRMEGRTMG